MRRREFIAMLGVAAAWPIAAQAQQRERMRRIGVLFPAAPSDREYQTRNAAFLQGLQAQGWTVGRNIEIHYNWATADPEQIRKQAAELVSLAPDAILASGSAALEAARLATKTVPIVFASVIDPVSQGYVASLAHPGGNATGFANFEFGLSGKWVEVLREVAPHVTRVGILRSPTITTMGQIGAMQAAAPMLGIEPVSIDAHDVAELEHGIAAFAQKPNGGLIILASNLGAYRKTIVTLASRYRLPAVYPFSYYVKDGGLLSYGPMPTDDYRRAAAYIDRILKGEKAADLPVQTPTKYEIAINLKAAKKLGLDVPPTLLARADEVIE
jgi:putative ABC transport system substrate-binding protein